MLFGAVVVGNGVATEVGVGRAVTGAGVLVDRSVGARPTAPLVGGVPLDARHRHVLGKGISSFFFASMAFSELRDQELRRITITSVATKVAVHSADT